MLINVNLLPGKRIRYPLMNIEMSDSGTHMFEKFTSMFFSLMHSQRGPFCGHEFTERKGFVDANHISSQRSGVFLLHLVIG